MARRRCGRCGGTGHYKVTCKKKASAKKKAGKKAKKSVKGSKIRRRSTGSVTASRRGYGALGAGKGWLALWHGGSTGSTRHDKTWAIKIIKKSGKCQIVTRHGRRTGAQNETSRKPQTCAAAIAAAQKLIRSKFAKGYMLIAANKRRRTR